MERVTADGSADLFLFSAESRDIRHHFFFFEGMKCRFILLRHGRNLQFRYRGLGIELLQAGIRIGIGKSLPQFRKLSFVLLRVPRQRSLAVRHTLQQFPAVSHAQLFPDLLCRQVFCSQRCYCNSCLRQRVALARAIVTRPKVLLLDEPLSAIDAKLRKSLQVEIRRIQKQLNITTIFVTHDQDEAMVMSDRICLLNCGNIEQMDTPIAIYTHPRTKFAAGFIGSYNVLEPLEFGRVTGDIDLPAQPIAIRPEVLNIAREKQNLPGTYDIEGTVIDSTPRGNVLRYKVDVNGVQLSADTLFRSFSIYENGSKVWLSLEKRNCLHVEEEAV